MWIYPLIAVTSDPSTGVPLSAVGTYDELMTHLPFGGLGHRGRDHHKAPQHIEPAGIKATEWKKLQINSILNISRLNELFHKRDTTVPWSKREAATCWVNAHRLPLSSAQGSPTFFSLNVHLFKDRVKPPIICSSDLTVLQQPIIPLSLRPQVVCGLHGVEQRFLFPLRVHGQISQLIRGCLRGANKLMGLNSKHVFPLHASLWGCTHPEDVVIHIHKHTHTHTHTHTLRLSCSQHPKSSCTKGDFLFEVWSSREVVYGFRWCWVSPFILG